MALIGEKIRLQDVLKPDCLQKKRSMVDVLNDRCKIVRIYERSHTRDAELMHYLGFFQQSHTAQDTFPNALWA